MHNVWQKIINSRGNEKEIKKYFQLFPILDAHIEDLISLHIIQAQQCIHNATTTLDHVLQDYFVTINIDNWDSQTKPQYPSVIQQMCNAAVRYKNILTTNYYYPLYIEEEHHQHTASLETDTMANQISGSATDPSTPMAIDNNFHVDVIDLAQLDSLISQQLNDDANNESLSMTPDATQNVHRHASLFVYRIVLRRLYGVKTPGISRNEAFKSFYIAMKHEDNQAAIRPFYSGDEQKLPSITASTQVQQPEQIDIQRYHRGFVPNQKFSLTGEMVIESTLAFEALEIALSGWLHKHYYSISLSECQTAELVTVGVLIHSSFTINRNELNASLKSIINSKPEDERFDISIRKDHWYCSAGKIDMLFVAVDRPNINTGINFMSRMYDGVNQAVPQGNKMWFFPTYQIDITEEIREKIGQEQRTWRGNEMACFVQGFHDVSRVVKLADGSSQTIRNILFRFPSGIRGHPRRTLFHGVDKDPVHDGWIILRYHRDDASLFRQRSSNLAFEINKLLEEGEDTRVFINPDVGLSFGGEITNNKAYSAKFFRGRKRNPVPVDSEIVQHFNTMIGKLQNISVKRPQVNLPPPEAASHHSTIRNSYAARASSSTITSTTRTSESSAVGRNDTVQTTTSVTVVEQYEQRFVRVEMMCKDNATRITKIERTTGKTNDMIKELLRHSGIAIDDDEETNEPPAALTTDQMDIENIGMNQGAQGGTKRTRQGDSQHELSTPGDLPMQNE